MKKWEQQNQQRQHQKKIQEAKSTFAAKTTNKGSPDSRALTSAGKNQNDTNYVTVQSPQHSLNDTKGSYSSGLSDYFDFEKQDLTQIPLYRLLKHYSLQQYAKGLISRGFGYDLSRLATLTRTEMDQLLGDIKMLPGHRVKLMKLVSQVTQICFEIMDQDDLKHFKQNFINRTISPDNTKPKSATGIRTNSYKKPTEQKPSTSNAVEKKAQTGAKSGQQTNIKKPQDVSKATVNKKNMTKKKLEKIGFDFFSDSQSMDDEFSRVLDDLLDQYRHNEIQQSQLQAELTFSRTKKEPSDEMLLNRVNYSQSEDLRLQLKEAMAKINTLENTGLNDTLNKLADDSTIPMTNDKSTLCASPGLNIVDSSKSSRRELSSPAKTKDIPNMPVLEEVQEKLTGEHRARVLDLIEKKLDPQHLNQNELHLEYTKIKDMYSSFEGAKMTSTIANLDIEEMSHCLSCAVQKHIDYFLSTIYSAGDFLLTPDANNSPKKEHEIRQLRFNFSNQASSQPVTRPENKNKIKQDMSFAGSSQEETVFCTSGLQDSFRHARETVQKYNGYLEGHDQELILHEDDELCLEQDGFDHKSIGSVGDEEEKLAQEGIEESPMKRKKKVDQENPQDYIKGDEPEESEEEIGAFLKKSLKDSLLLNMKQEKKEDINTDSRKGFTMQLRPIEMADYQSESIDLRSQVINNDPIKEFDGYGKHSEIIYQRKNDNNAEFSMEESLYSELEMDNENMDVAKRIRNVFERTFNEKNLTLEEYNKRIQYTVDKDFVANFCKNIIIRTKMEKEVVIICLIYIERLIVRTNMYINAINWKRIAFTALILASKIWDDDSFENNHFAKAFTQYTVKEINELERVFLEFLDYDIMVNPNEYTKYYFILRAFAEKSKKSFPLKAVNMQTVRMLQKNAAKTSKTLKEVYADPLNKTFS